MQLFALGRNAHPEELARDARAMGVDEADFPYVSSGNVPLSDESDGIRATQRQWPPPRLEGACRARMQLEAPCKSICGALGR